MAKISNKARRKKNRRKKLKKNIRQNFLKRGGKKYRRTVL